MEFVFLTIGIVIFMVATVCVFIKYVRVIVLKGYSLAGALSLSIISVLLASLLLTLIAGIFVIPVGIDPSDIFGLLFIFGVVGILFLYGYVATKIPCRPIRTFGKRKEPLRFKLMLIIACGLLILAAIVIIISFISPGMLPKPIKWTWKDIIQIGAGISGAITWAAYVKKQRNLFKQQKDIIDYQQKPIGVLYLRSFYLDVLPFAFARKKNKEEFGDLMKLDDAIGGTALKFEEYFAYQISRKIGDFVCIGNPNDKLVKQGVTAIYPKWNEWQNLLLGYIDKAKIILMQIGQSNHIDFELNAIIQCGQLNKLCLFTPPYSDDKKRTLMHKFINWVFNARKLDWREVKAVIEKAGLTIDFMPGPGSVIVFDQSKRARLYKSGCILPSEYIMALNECFF